MRKEERAKEKRRKERVKGGRGEQKVKMLDRQSLLMHLKHLEIQAVGAKERTR